MTGDGRKWHTGTFVGVDQRTGQYMIHDSGNIKFARTIMRMPEPEKFNKEELAKIAVPACTTRGGGHLQEQK